MSIVLRFKLPMEINDKVLYNVSIVSCLRLPMEVNDNLL